MADPVTDSELISVLYSLSQDARAVLTALVSYANDTAGDTTFNLSSFTATVPNIAKQVQQARTANIMYFYANHGGF